MTDTTFNQSFEYVIVGGGLSASFTCRALVREQERLPKEVEPQNGQNKSESPNILIVSGEKFLPYKRYELLKEFANRDFHKKVDDMATNDGDADDPSAHSFLTCKASMRETQQAAWYKDNGVEVMTGTNVIDIDPGTNTILLEDMTRIKYTEAMFLCTGSSPRKLKVHSPSCNEDISYLRSAESIAELSRKVFEEPGQRSVVVVGGGLLGIELSFALVNNGVDVSLVHDTYYPLENVMSNGISEWLREQLLGAGIRLYSSNSVVEVGRANNTTSDGSKSAQYSVSLFGGEVLNADVVVAAVGVQPNFSLYKDKLETHVTNSGSEYVVVDESFQSSAPGVYAVGDIAVIKGFLCNKVDYVPRNANWAKVSAHHAVHFRKHLTIKQCAVMKTYFPLKYSPVTQFRMFRGNGETLQAKCFGLKSDDSIEVHFGDPNSEAFGVYWFSRLDNQVVASDSSESLVGKVQLLAALLINGVPTEIEAVESAVRKKIVLDERHLDAGIGLELAFGCLEDLACDALQHIESKEDFDREPDKLYVNINGRTVDVLASLQHSFTQLCKMGLQDKVTSNLRSPKNKLLTLKKNLFGDLCASLDLKLSPDELSEALLAFPKEEITYQEFEAWWLS